MMYKNNIFIIFLLLITIFSVSCGQQENKKKDAELLNFPVLSKSFVKGGSFSAAEIVQQVSGEKNGYFLKEIKNISDTSVASLANNRKSINFPQSRFFYGDLGSSS